MIKDFFLPFLKLPWFFFIRIFLLLLHILHCFKILLRKRQENLLNKLGTEVIRARTFLFLILFLHSLIILLFFLQHRGIEALWFVACKDRNILFSHNTIGVSFPFIPFFMQANFGSLRNEYLWSSFSFFSYFINNWKQQLWV